MAMMKPFLTKTLDVITFGTLSRRQRGNTTVESHVQAQQSLSTNSFQVPEHEDCENGWSIYSTSHTSENLETLEDDVLFCKNNVFLKFPGKRTRSPSNSSNTSSTNSGGSLTESVGHSIPMRSLSGSNCVSGDNIILIPGYLYISTRGSDFGQTLILNWTPNSIISPDDSVQSPKGANPVDKPSCSSVSIDLGQMESIHVFYQTGSDVTTGEVVISTRERRYKVFYFKNGGLNDLIKKFRSWKYFNYQHQSQVQQYLFTVFRPRLSLAELHPEEGLVFGILTDLMWSQLQDPTGRVLDKRLVLQTVFFRGLHSSLRKELWPYLLGLIDFEIPVRQKKEKSKQNQDVYKQINYKREQLQSQSDASLLQQIINDVNRTDRSHPFYKGEGNKNLDRLQQILLNYLLIYRTDISYCQGMTDLLSPLLYTMDDNAEAFFCFTSVVERSPFFKPAKDRVSLRRQVTLLLALIQVLLPWFYTYLMDVEGGPSLLFAHRWLLVCMKREFKMDDTLCIWEACWTNYSTNSFHLFVCVAVVAIYGQRSVDQNMNINELTIHFNSLSNSLPVDIVLSQARGYLYQFTKCPEVPCVLRSIMFDDFWEGTRSPKLACEGSGSCCRGNVPLSIVT